MSLPTGNLAAHPDKGEIFLDRALERAREFGDGVFGEVRANRGRGRSIIHPHMIAERGRKSDAGADRSDLPKYALSARLRGEREETRRIGDGEGEVGAAPRRGQG